MKCPLTGCHIGKLLLATIISFAAVFGFDYAFHSIYMMPDYVATSELWRDQAGMQERFNFMLGSKAIKAFAYAVLFCWLQKGGASGMISGIRFGLIAGLLVGACSLGCYAYMPIPLEMALKWLSGEVVLGLIIGILLTMFAGGKKCCDAGGSKKDKK